MRECDPRYLEEEHWSLPSIFDHVHSVQLAILMERKGNMAVNHASQLHH